MARLLLALILLGLAFAPPAIYGDREAVTQEAPPGWILLSCPSRAALGGLEVDDVQFILVAWHTKDGWLLAPIQFALVVANCQPQDNSLAPYTPTIPVYVLDDDEERHRQEVHQELARMPAPLLLRLVQVETVVLVMHPTLLPPACPIACVPRHFILVASDAPWAILHEACHVLDYAAKGTWTETAASVAMQGGLQGVRASEAWAEGCALYIKDKQFLERYEPAIVPVVEAAFRIMGVQP